MSYYTRKPELTLAHHIASAAFLWLVINWPIMGLLLHNFHLLTWSKAFLAAGIMTAVMELTVRLGLKIISVVIFWGVLLFAAGQFTVNLVVL